MDILLILTLVLMNGFFAMAEIAIISSRKSKLKNLGINNPNSRTALQLAEKPNTFLSSVQIGITLITILAGALSEDRFVSHISPLIKNIPFIGQFHMQIAFGVVVLGITFLSIVLGELVPKRIALSNPEKIASLVAPFMVVFSKITAPAVSLLSTSTEFIFKLVGLPSGIPSRVTEDEVRVLIREGTDMGIFSKTEKKIIERALMLDDLKVGMLMTPRHKMTIVNVKDLIENPKRCLTQYPHSRIILTEDTKDGVFGVIHVKDLLNYSFDDKYVLENLKTITDKPHLVPESMKAIKVLELFRHSPVHIALVVDEFGNIQGLLTLNDILEALVGEIRTQAVQGPLFVARDNGSYLVDGTVSIYDLKKKLRLKDVKEEDLSAYQTVAGLVISHLEKIPQAGDVFEKYNHRFEVVDMDHNRVDKILVKKIIV